MEDEGFALHRDRERAADLARDAADAVVELGNRLSVSVQPMAEDANVEADRSRLLQVFRNLLSNAEKYSDPGSAVQLLVDATEAEVMFEVIDRGPGIAEEDNPRLFQRFSRIRAPHTTTVRGSGLGLFISRGIVEAHGGRIWAESTSGIGSRFGFSIPRPSFRIALAQVAAGIVNYAFVATTLYVLFGGTAGVGPFAFASFYAVAHALGALSHVPGGLGVLELVVLSAAPGASSAGALIVFRVVYYFAPFVLGALLYCLHEIRRRSARLRAVPGEGGG